MRRGCCSWRPALSSSVLLALLLFSGWVDDVDPILTKEQKQAYRSLRDDEAREKFETGFWATKSISREEYARRTEYVKAAFGGWRTDRSRMYLSLGAPQKITRLSSTRSFWPIEIWYYSSASGIGVSSAIQFLFFQRNQTGDYRAYSPTLDTFTALLNPQSGTRGAFRVNDLLTEGDIRNTMNLTPAELEIVDAAMGVAKGIKGMENDAILARATSPETALSRTPNFQVTTKFTTRFTTASRPLLSTFQSWSGDGTAAVDFSLQTAVQRTIGMAVSTESTELAVTQLAGRRIRYQHRLALLPGTYVVTFTVDGVPWTYPLQVGAPRRVSEILLGEVSEQIGATPFQFGTVHFDSTETKQALLQVPEGETVTWRLRQNARTLWTQQSKGPVAVVTLNEAAGKYELEARCGAAIREVAVVLGEMEAPLPVISYNANLTSGKRARSLGRQWLARGELVEARTWLTRAMALEPSDALRVDLARVGAMAGDLDGARKELLAVLSANPEAFEALTVMGFIEGQLQDYQVAAEYYRKALAIRASPAVQRALEQVTGLVR